jgi:hypothetical protein
MTCSELIVGDGVGDKVGIDVDCVMAIVGRAVGAKVFGDVGRVEGLEMSRDG